MKKIIVALIAASGMLVAAPLPAMADVDVAFACDDSSPASWKRPGGFCDQNDFNKSLSEPSSDQGCTPIVLGMIGGDREARMLLAASPGDCCASPATFRFDPSESTIIVADRGPCYLP